MGSVPQMPRHVAIEEAAGNVAFGLKKGHKTTPSGQAAKISRRKGKLNNRVKVIRDVVRECIGFAPYEKRCIELLRVNKDKRALKYCKKKLGTHSRAKRKREEMADVIVAQRKAQSAQ